MSEAFWIEKMNQFEMEEARIISEISAHKTADTRYLERGSVTLELAQRAESLYESAPPARKRKILQILLSNSTMTGGIIAAQFREPFEILLKMAGAWKSEKPGPDMRKPGFEMWRG